MNILIIKIGALGDVLRTSYIAQALKDKYYKSDPKIFWVTGEKAIPLFSNNSYVDKIIDEKNKQKLRNIKFDVVINLEEDLDNAKFVRSLNTKEILGFYFDGKKIIPSKSAKEWFNMSILGESPRNDELKKKNKKSHRQIIGEIVEINYEKYEPFLRLNNSQRKLADNFRRRHNLKDELVIGINTGAADRWPKSLPIKNTADLINQIYKKYKTKILLFGGPNETERNKKIIELVKCPLIDTGCGNNLLEFPALISLCNAFITTDSLGLHVALALKRKTIVLVGPTSPAELDMYGIGEKIISDSKDVASYKTKTDCMDKISINEIIKNLDNLLDEKITLVVTAFKEPKTIGKSIESALNQKTAKKYNVLLSAPDEETLSIAKKYEKKYKNLATFKDPGKGKSFALNLIFKKIDSDIIILTDGDVHISDNSVEEIINLFKDPEIGCITGRPVPVENKENKYGYWANFLFDSAHEWRKHSFEKNNFIECSGYLFAFRKNKIKKIPLDVAEDTVIPYFFWEKGYRIGYAQNALVYVKNADNWQDWIKQKIRTSKAHETLNKYVDTTTTPRMKNFGNESKGAIKLFTYPNNFHEFYWSFQLALARLYMWGKVFLDTKIRNKQYGDAWERVESTKQ